MHRPAVVMAPETLFHDGRLPAALPETRLHHGQPRSGTVGNEPASDDLQLSVACLRSTTYVSRLTYVTEGRLETLHDTIGAISTQLRLRFAATASPEIGFVALATLRHLTRHGPKSVSDLAYADHVSTQAISLRIRPLIDAGLLTRRIDTADARRTIVAVTAPGRAAVANAEASARDALNDALDRLPASDRDTLSAALPALHQVATILSEESP